MATRTKTARAELPFKLVVPNVPSYISANSDGSYDVTIQVVVLVEPDKNLFPVSLTVDSRVLPGAEMLSGDRIYTFHSVTPEPGKELVLGFQELADPTSKIEITIAADQFKPLVGKTGSAQILVETSYVGSDKAHQVRIRLFDKDGASRDGQVEISAGQDFEVDGTKYSGVHNLDISGPVGMSVRIKPLAFDEGFKFSDLANRLSVTKVLLARK